MASTSTRASPSSQKDMDPLLAASERRSNGPRSWGRASLSALAGLLLVCTSARADDIDRYIAQEQRLYDLPAVVVGVMRDGQLIDERVSGHVNLELGVNARLEHRFEIGSISKQFTAYAILILKARGKLELDAAVGRYLSDLPVTWGKVSLHHLLSHTSGLPDLEDAFGYGIYRETPSDAEFLKRLIALPIEFEQGDKWQYSNTNYWLLARVIESISGMRYSDFMAKEVFTPLGMSATSSALPAQVLINRASGYEKVGSHLENRDAIQPNTGRGLGDIVTNLDDMSLWEREQLAPRLVPPELAAIALKPVRLNSGASEPYGYGWSTEKILPVATLSHDGQTAGFSAAYIRVPDRRLAVVVFINSYAGTPAQIGMHALGEVDPTLRPAKLEAVVESDSEVERHVRQVLRTGASADQEWRVEWFDPDYWRSLRPWLKEIARSSQRFGRFVEATLVAKDEGGLTYRVSYDSVIRIVTVRVDGQGRINGRMGRDE